MCINLIKSEFYDLINFVDALPNDQKIGHSISVTSETIGQWTDNITGSRNI